jgi:hypothetical protein
VRRVRRVDGATVGIAAGPAAGLFSLGGADELRIWLQVVVSGFF